MIVGFKSPEAVDVPIWGVARSLGLPLFTLAIGLVDGFNPCAMWVLLFLLSILVNLHSRTRILAVAGTFVLISGLAYFAFMAAWLTIFQFIGFLRPAQVVLGMVAMLIVPSTSDFRVQEGDFTVDLESAAGHLCPRPPDRHAENLTGAVIGRSPWQCSST
jgi:thiol:disulfide interchange protein